MQYPSEPAQTIALLQKYNLRLQKKFGQNFLVDSHVIERIIKASKVTRDDFVLEIGPGIGTMTRYLCDAARFVTAIEIDGQMIPVLKDVLSNYGNIEIVNADILKVDIKSIVDEKNDGRPIKVVANLPYYITTPIIMSLFETHIPIESMTVMVQREVADRMISIPGSKDYGALSLAVQYYAAPEIVANVPPNCFLPRPKVGSAVIRLEKYAYPPVSVSDESLMFAVIRAAFNQRRKTLANALGNAAGIACTKEQARAAIAAAGLPCNVRGESLTLEQFAKLTDAIARTADNGNSQ